MAFGHQDDPAGYVEVRGWNAGLGSQISYLQESSYSSLFTSYYSFFDYCVDRCNAVEVCNSITMFKQAACYLRTGCVNASVASYPNHDDELDDATYSTSFGYDSTYSTIYAKACNLTASVTASTDSSTSSGSGSWAGYKNCKSGDDMRACEESECVWSSCGSTANVCTAGSAIGGCSSSETLWANSGVCTSCCDLSNCLFREEPNPSVDPTLEPTWSQQPSLAPSASVAPSVSLQPSPSPSVSVSPSLSLQPSRARSCNVVVKGFSSGNSDGNLASLAVYSGVEGSEESWDFDFSWMSRGINRVTIDLQAGSIVDYENYDTCESGWNQLKCPS